VEPGLRERPDVDLVLNRDHDENVPTLTAVVVRTYRSKNAALQMCRMGAPDGTHLLTFVRASVRVAEAPIGSSVRALPRRNLHPLAACAASDARNPGVSGCTSIGACRTVGIVVRDSRAQQGTTANRGLTDQIAGPVPVRGP
jgi:hypothetical protein